MKSKTYDLVVIGGGSTAIAAAHSARKMGKTSVITEEGEFGGICLNTGCMPSKFLIEVARVIYSAEHTGYAGICGTRLSFDFSKLISEKDDMLSRYRQKKYENLSKEQIDIEFGQAKFVDDYTVEIGQSRLIGRKILIATGSRSEIPQIKGLSGAGYLTSDLLSSDAKTQTKSCPRSLLVIGGGYIALELGQMFHRFGADVTIFERSHQVLARGYEPEVGPLIKETFKQNGIQMFCDSSIISVERTDNGIAAVVQIGEEKRQFHAEEILIAAGRRPNTDRIGLEKTSLETTETGYIKVNKHLQTNVSHIFAAGDAIGSQLGSQMATPVGTQDGTTAAHNAFSAESLQSVDHRVIPRTIFTDPQIAFVGMTESDALAAGHTCISNSIDMSSVPRAVLSSHITGMAKMVADAKSEEVLGVTIISNNAGEVVHEAAMALRFKARINDFIEQIHVYPTMSEALRLVALSLR